MTSGDIRWSISNATGTGGAPRSGVPVLVHPGARICLQTPAMAQRRLVAGAVVVVEQHELLRERMVIRRGLPTEFQGRHRRASHHCRAPRRLPSKISGGRKPRPGSIPGGHLAEGVRRVRKERQPSEPGAHPVIRRPHRGHEPGLSNAACRRGGIGLWLFLGLG